MSIADTQRIKALEHALAALEARVLMLEMQKQPVQAVGFMAEPRKTLSLRGRAA